MYDYNNIMTIKHLVISGGAYKGFYTLGVLKHLFNKNYLQQDQIENVYGTSAGSILALLICLKLDFNDITDYAINRPWEKEIKFDTSKLLETFKNQGYFGNEFFINIFSGLFHNAKLSKEITFKELYEYSKIKLNIYTVNISNWELEVLNYEKTPDLKVLQGIHMSCSIPFVFQPIFYNNCIYGDGGIINPYPIDMCLQENVDKKEILSIRIIDKELSQINESSNIFYYGFYLLFKLIVENYKNKNKNLIENEIIIPGIQLNIQDAKNIIYNKTDREKLIEQGENYARIFLYKKEDS